jgi:hypothetical protein
MRKNSHKHFNFSNPSHDKSIVYYVPVITYQIIKGSKVELSREVEKFEFDSYDDASTHFEDLNEDFYNKEEESSQEWVDQVKNSTVFEAIFYDFDNASERKERKRDSGEVSGEIFEDTYFSHSLGLENSFQRAERLKERGGSFEFVNCHFKSCRFGTLGSSFTLIFKNCTFKDTKMGDVNCDQLRIQSEGSFYFEGGTFCAHIKNYNLNGFEFKNTYFPRSFSLSGRNVNGLKGIDPYRIFQMRDVKGMTDEMREIAKKQKGNRVTEIKGKVAKIILRVKKDPSMISNSKLKESLRIVNSWIVEMKKVLGKDIRKESAFFLEVEAFKQTVEFASNVLKREDEIKSSRSIRQVKDLLIDLDSMSKNSESRNPSLTAKVDEIKEFAKTKIEELKKEEGSLLDRLFRRRKSSIQRVVSRYLR